MARIIAGLLLILLTASKSVAQVPSDSIEAYIELGSRIKSCWFNLAQPVFPEHMYQAEVQPDGKRVRITIHEREKLGRPGKIAYVVQFVPTSSRTIVKTQNVLMTPEVAARMKFDIDRWRRGETVCVKKPPAAPTTAAAEKPSLASEAGSALGRLWDRARGKTEEASP